MNWIFGMLVLIFVWIAVKIHNKRKSSYAPAETEAEGAQAEPDAEQEPDRKCTACDKTERDLTPCQKDGCINVFCPECRADVLDENGFCREHIYL